MLLVYGAGAAVTFWLSIYVMLIGGLIQFVDALFNTATTMREITILFGLLRMIIGPFIGLLVLALTLEIADVIGKEK